MLPCDTLALRNSLIMDVVVAAHELRRMQKRYDGA